MLVHGDLMLKSIRWKWGYDDLMQMQCAYMMESKHYNASREGKMCKAQWSTTRGKGMGRRRTEISSSFHSMVRKALWYSLKKCCGQVYFMVAFKRSSKPIFLKGRRHIRSKLKRSAKHWFVEVAKPLKNELDLKHFFIKLSIMSALSHSQHTETSLLTLRISVTTGTRKFRNCNFKEACSEVQMHIFCQGRNTMCVLLVSLLHARMQWLFPVLFVSNGFSSPYHIASWCSIDCCY